MTSDEGLLSKSAHFKPREISNRKKTMGKKYLLNLTNKRSLWLVGILWSVCARSWKFKIGMSHRSSLIQSWSDSPISFLLPLISLGVGSVKRWETLFTWRQTKPYGDLLLKQSSLRTGFFFSSCNSDVLVSGHLSHTEYCRALWPVRFCLILQTCARSKSVIALICTNSTHKFRDFSIHSLLSYPSSHVTSFPLSKKYLTFLLNAETDQVALGMT